MRMRVLVIGVIALVGAWAATAHGGAPLTIYTIAGGDGQGFAGDGGPATSASLDGPQGLAVAPDGTIYVADTINQRVRRIDASGRITTIAGTGKRGFSGDGGPATRATFEDPSALALAPGGALYVTDTGNNRVRVIRPDGTIATVAGAADQGFSGDGGPATSAQLNSPAGLAVGSDGRVFVSDTGNNRVREIRPDGTIATVAAQLNAPAGLAVAPDGSLLVADNGDNRVMRVAAEGTVTDVAGNGGGASTGDGGAAKDAQLNGPVDVAALSSGGFFVVEQGGDRIRFVDPTGHIFRLTGTGAPRYGGDGRVTTAAFLNAPRAIELDPANELLIADTDNNRIRYTAFPGSASRLAIAPLANPVTTMLRKVKAGKKRVLVLRNVAMPVSLSKPATLSIRVLAKKGRSIATFRSRLRAGTQAIHLPPRLRSGKRRLTKGYYVLRVTATAGSASATASLELIVR